MIQTQNIKKSLLWDITRSCNLNCIHCYNSGNTCYNDTVDIRNNYEIIIDRILKMGVTHIHLLGGEPLVANGIYDLLHYAHSKNLIVTINTNGTLLTDKVLEILISTNVSQITVSLDGADEYTNDAIRGTGSFTKAVEGLSRAVSYTNLMNSSMIIQVATVISRLNSSSIYKMPRLLDNLGVKYLDVLHLYTSGNACLHDAVLYLDDKEYLDLLCKMIIECFRWHVYVQLDCKPLVLDIIMNRYGIRNNSSSTQAGCYAGKQILFMDSFGYIYPCGPYSQKKKHYSLATSIFDDNYLDNVMILEQDIISQLNELSIQPKDICTRCKYNLHCIRCALCDSDYTSLCTTAYQRFICS